LVTLVAGGEQDQKEAHVGSPTSAPRPNTCLRPSSELSSTGDTLALSLFVGTII
jgi:hypothetical protein